MASGIASAMGRLGTVGLAAAIFIPWMNVSGSILANYWSKRPQKIESPSDAVIGASITPAAQTIKREG
jgi:BASS family bile acid:Na+ symporter